MPSRRFAKLLEPPMPFARISLLVGKPPAYLAAISDSLHAAMVETFDVPAKDRFHVIHQHQSGELLFDRDFLGGPRSDDYVLFHITIGKPRSRAVKERFYRRLVERLADAPGLRPEDVMVVLTANEMGLADWSFAGGVSANPEGVAA
jgi:phenylpyruvate tautomerase PptA (4-oxalocrotonate tautomerase family)